MAAGEEEIINEVNKGGETVITTILGRSLKGISLNVKIHPKIEEFMRGLADGQTRPVRLSGRYWIPQNDKELEVYEVPAKELRGVLPAAHLSYRLDKPGVSLYDKDGNEGMATVDPYNGVTRPAINLSFIRLVGASEGAGITFYLNNVYSKSMLEEINEGLTITEREFYKEFMKPFRTAIFVSTQQL